MRTTAVIRLNGREAHPVSDDEIADLPQQLRVRRDKYDRLMADPERAPFSVRVARTAALREIRARYPELAAGTETGDLVCVTGRVIFVRNTGKLCFAMLREGGAELQVMLSLDREVIDWFRQQGGDFRDRITEVLREHVRARRKDAA